MCHFKGQQPIYSCLSVRLPASWQTQQDDSTRSTMQCSNERSNSTPRVIFTLPGWSRPGSCTVCPSLLNGSSPSKTPAQN